MVPVCVSVGAMERVCVRGAPGPAGEAGGLDAELTRGRQRLPSDGASCAQGTTGRRGGGVGTLLDCQNLPCRLGPGQLEGAQRVLSASPPWVGSAVEALQLH